MDENINNTNQTDLTFFTNEEGNSLLDRFKATLKDTQLFDVLVGYFRSSGFYQLYESLEPVEKVRILVGLSVDRDSYDILQYHEQLGMIDFESHKRTKKQFQENLKSEIETSDENDNKLEIGIRKFIEFLQEECKNTEDDKVIGGNGKKLEIRAYPSKNIHAKVYIGRFHPEDRDYGFVITGSSNFSESGFVANRILMPMINEAVETLYNNVAGVYEIDNVMKLGMGHPMGPLQLADFIGLDVCLSILNVMYDGFKNPKYAPCPLLVNMVQAGKLGIKSGEGFYDYSESRKAEKVSKQFS